MFTLILSLLLIVLSYVLLLEPLFLSRLSCIPNAHPLSALTSAWIQWQRYRGNEVDAVHQAFQKVGPIVRLAPREIAINTIDGGVRTVYGGGFHKADWYLVWANYGYRNVFSSVGNDHGRRRRWITSVYSKSNVQSSPQVQRIAREVVFNRLIGVIQSSCEANTPLDVIPLNLSYGLDFVSAFVFGLSHGTKFVVDTKARDDWFGAYMRSHSKSNMYWLQEHPIFTKFLSRIGISLIPSWADDAQKWLEEWALKVVDAVEADELGAGNNDGQSRWPASLYTQLKVSILKDSEIPEVIPLVSDPPQMRLQLASECLDHLVATRDVFGITFTFIIFDLSSNPDFQDKLREELRSLPQSLSLERFKELPSCKILEKLPLLNAACKESLRLRGTLPTSNPRITPKDRETTIGPYRSIPGGVRVNCFAWCLHHNEEVFPEPDVWRPERWLVPDEERSEQEKWLWTFGSGSRRCVGDALAMEMIRYAIAAIYSNFTSSLVDTDGFKNGDWVTGKPGDKLIVRFSPAC